MRLTGLFSHSVLAFVCLGLTFVAFESASIPVEPSAQQATSAPQSSAGVPTASADPAPVPPQAVPPQAAMQELAPAVVSEPVAAK
ncbi:MAG: hypothetical protein ABL901_13675, partial [Hyphomicrobiaceae bacterium]